MGENMKSIAVGIIAAIVIGLLFVGAGLSCKEAQEKAAEEILEPGEISEAEEQEIQRWIEENDLNKYGDPKNMFYPGGTPLFDEGTGETIDLYEYILRNHPDRPWLE